MENEKTATQKFRHVKFDQWIVGALLLGTPATASIVIGHSVWAIARVAAHPASPALAILFGIAALLIAVVCFFVFLKDAADFVIIPVMAIVFAIGLSSVIVHARERAIQRQHSPSIDIHETSRSKATV